MQVDSWDEDVSEWARDETPVFGSEGSAQDWSDGMRNAAHARHADQHVRRIVIAGLDARPRRSYGHCARADFERRAQLRTHVDGLQVVHRQRIEHRGIGGMSRRQALVVIAVRTLAGRCDFEALRDAGRHRERADTDRGIARFCRNPATVACATRRCEHADGIARDRRVPQAIDPILRAAL